jgi:uncharacterized protein YbaP (TraB family)
MSKQIGRRAGALIALLSWSLAALGAESAERHALWSLQGRTNTVYLLGSVHFLKQSEPLPEAIDEAYGEAEALLMELDMDDLDPLEVQQLTLELGVLPPDQSLESLLGSETYARVATKSRELGMDPTMLNRFRPWLAAMTLVQLHLMKLGLDPQSGIEQRLTARAGEDEKPIHGLETLRQQLSMLASLSEEHQREFLLYSVDDAERAAQEAEELIAAWRRGDTEALSKLLAEGFEQYPDLYRPLTVDRNRRWLPRIEELLQAKEDYLVVVGALHLVGEDSVIELLERKGYKVTQH